MVVATGLAPALAALSTPCLCYWATRPLKRESYKQCTVLIPAGGPQNEHESSELPSRDPQFPDHAG
jgi:hypothetical protein